MRILVVDDDPISRRIIEAALTSFGHDSDVAEDGERAWAAFESAPYDMVITDRDMPGLSGVELCRRIRRHPLGRRTFVVVVTVRGDRADAIDGVSAGADDYLRKPLDVGELQLRLIVAARVAELHAQLEAVSQELRVAVRTDPLTRVGNRLAMQEELALLHARTQRYGGCFAIALIDVDNFKLYNDTYGHLQGDRALSAVADVIAGGLRTGDTVFRYGGEEFVCVLPAQLEDGARTALERVRTAVRSLDLEHARNPAGVVTVSAGIACFSQGDPRSTDQLVSAADAALYRAKGAGRDRVA